MKIYLVFTKYTKKFIAFTSDIEQFPKENFLFKEYSLAELGLEGDEFNLARFRFEGDYDNGTLIDLFKAKKAEVTEEEVDKKYFGILFRKYPIDKLLYLLALNAAGIIPEDFSEFREFMQMIREKKENEIAFYKKSPNHFYDSKKDRNARQSQVFVKK